MHVTDCIKCLKRVRLGVCGTWGTCPSRKILISDLRLLLVPFVGVKQQELDDQLPI